MIEQRECYVSYPASEYREVAQERTPFLVDGVISNKVTLIYGQSESGKSMLVQGLIAALTNGGLEFLGRNAQSKGPGFSVGVLCGDYDDGQLYSERIERANGDLTKVQIYDASSRMPFEAWAGLHSDALQRNHDLLVIDNISTFIPGDINQGPPCQAFFDGISRFTQTMAVAVLAHSTEKKGQWGAQDFIGHSIIKQRPSWHCKVIKHDDYTRTLKFHGNRNGGHEISITSKSPDTPLFDVIGTADSAQLAQRKASNKRTLDATQKAERDKIRDAVLETGKGRNETARLLAPRFGLAESTMKVHLTNGRYGVRWSDGAWVDARNQEAA